MPTSSEQFPNREAMANLTPPVPIEAEAGAERLSWGERLLLPFWLFCFAFMWLLGLLHIVGW